MRNPVNRALRPVAPESGRELLRKHGAVGGREKERGGSGLSGRADGVWGAACGSCREAGAVERGGGVDEGERRGHGSVVQVKTDVSGIHCTHCGVD